MARGMEMVRAERARVRAFILGNGGGSMGSGVWFGV